MSTFIDKFRKFRGLSNLEVAIRGSKDEPIPDLGELVKDYIDTKGDKYDPEKLMLIFAPRYSRSPYGPYIDINSEKDQNIIDNHKKMLASISSLVADPKYLPKIEEIIHLNKNFVNVAEPERSGPVFSVMDDMEKSIKIQRELTNNNPLRATPKPSKPYPY